MIKTAMKLPTGKELEILRLLALHPNGLYGLQLVDLSDDAIKRGSVYVYLARLKDDKLVASKETPAPAGYGGLPRPTYRITGHGKRVLDATETLGLALAGARP